MGERRPLVFVGFMGAGKSEAAAAVGDALEEEALDADAEIERELGHSIADHFRHQGEASFREVEQRVVLELLERGDLLSLGGGAVESEPVRRALAGSFVVWCRVEEERAWSRVAGTDRPLARDRAGFARRFEARQPLYESVADAVLPDGGRAIARSAAHWLDAVARLRGGRLAWARSASGEYPAVLGEGAISLLSLAGADAALHNGRSGKAPGRFFCVADAAVLREQPGLLPAVEGTIEVEASEERKTLSEAESVLRSLARAGVRREDVVLALGGGVVGDLAGFCAATYQRGIPVVQAPTTLVAQVDSAYGGKTGVDLPEAKNYAGAYHLPLAVLADPRALRTLPQAELAAGFVEVVKTALIAGGPLWDRVRELESLDPETLGDVIFACARTKLDIVAADERDSGRRAVLNLGHTVGHAIEAASGYSRYRHGEAVGLGLLAALRLSGAVELRAEVADLLARNGLPVSLEAELAVDRVVEACRRDKKAMADGVGFVLVERPGEVISGQSVDPDSLSAAVSELGAKR